jgi:hypothetical protein
MDEFASADVDAVVAEAVEEDEVARIPLSFAAVSLNSTL